MRKDAIYTTITILATAALMVLFATPLTTQAQDRGGRGGGGYSRGGGGHSRGSSGSYSAPRSSSFSSVSRSSAPRNSGNSSVYRSSSPRGGYSSYAPRESRFSNTYYRRGGYSRYEPRVIVRHPIYYPRVIAAPYAYYWHPYRPYFGWGFGWYPVGSIFAGIATTAIIVGTINSSNSNVATSSPNNESTQVYYDKGNFYQQSGNHYRVIDAPMGMVIPEIPEGSTECTVNGVLYNYFAGVFYQKVDDGYQVVKAPVTAIVFDLPPGANQVSIEGQIYYELKGVYFQPIKYENDPAFQVVENPSYATYQPVP